jgi:hypothetical protein
MVVSNKQRMESAAKQAVRQRNYRRARDRALVRLAHHYPEKYQEYLKRERERDEANGKAWLDIDGTRNSDVDIHTEEHPPAGETTDTGKSYNGAEA